MSYVSAITVFIVNLYQVPLKKLLQIFQYLQSKCPLNYSEKGKDLFSPKEPGEQTTHGKCLQYSVVRISQRKYTLGLIM